MDIAIGLRQGGRGRYRQRGRNIKGLYLENGTFFTWSIVYSDLRLDIATDTGRYLLHKGQILRSL